MTRRGDRSGAAAEPYSPHRRTALVLTGTGTAGAYHAGVLRALHEAGVKIDLVGGRGMGAVSALFAAVDGGTRLWEEDGFWTARRVAHLYPWHPLLRLMATAMAIGLAIIAIPLLAMAAGLVVFPVDFALKMMGATGSGLAAAYLQFAETAFAPTALPTWLPRLAVVVFGAALALAVVAAVMRAPRRRGRGPFWWRLVPAPLSAAEMVAHCWGVLWDLLRGAANVSQPDPGELARRYAELLSDNLGQPGFRELVITVHDLDTRRDLVCAVVAEDRREDLVRRGMSDADVRHAEVLDLAGVARGHLADAIEGAVAIPLATASHAIQFDSDSFWRGEVHRLCDRPGSLLRLVDEIEALDVEQVILVTATAEIDAPHTLVPPRLDGRGRIGEHIQALEAAAVRDVQDSLRLGGLRLFVIRPSHNPVGPFDLRGGFDDRSDRRQPLTELMARGYEDAYRQFVDPVIAPSGERLGRVRSRAVK